jgi:hypothetical protein
VPYWPEIVKANFDILRTKHVQQFGKATNSFFLFSFNQTSATCLDTSTMASPNPN